MMGLYQMRETVALELKKDQGEEKPLDDEAVDIWRCG